MKRIIALSTMLSTFLCAYEFHPLGFESIGMGGAGVSNAKGSMAGYYNPALLAKSHYDLEISAQAGIGIKEDNLANHVDTLSTIDFTETVDRVTQPLNAFNALVLGVYDQSDKDNLKSAVDILKSVYAQNYLTILPTASFAIQYENFHLGLYNTTTASAHMVIDPNALELYAPYGDNSYIYYDPYSDTNPYSTISLTQEEYQASSLEYALESGKTYVELTGISLAEVPLSYATSFDTVVGSLSIGGSLKYMGAGVYSDKVQIDTKADDLVDQFDDHSKTSSNFGIDIGFLYQPIKEINIGLVGKNLNSPEFDTLDPNNKIVIDPMVRGGITLSLWDSVDLAFDYDITENETALDNQKSQYAGGGINIRPASWLSLRAGAMNNVAYEDSPFIYTAGIGLGLKWFQIDISAQVSDNLTMVDGTEVTDYAKVNLALISRWGDGYNRKTPDIEQIDQSTDLQNNPEKLFQDKTVSIYNENKEVANEK